MVMLTGIVILIVIGPAAMTGRLSVDTSRIQAKAGCLK